MMWLEDKQRPERIGWLVWLNLDPYEVQMANLAAYLRAREHFDYIIVVVRHPDEGCFWTRDVGLRNAIACLRHHGYKVILMASRWIRVREDVKDRPHYVENMYNSHQWLDIISLTRHVANYFGCFGYGLYAEPHRDSDYAGLFAQGSDAWNKFNEPRNRSHWKAVADRIRRFVSQSSRFYLWPADCSVRESPELALGRGSCIGRPLTGGTWGCVHPSEISTHLKTLDEEKWHPGPVWGSRVALEPEAGKSISPADVHRVDWAAVHDEFNWTGHPPPNLHWVYIDDVTAVEATVDAISKQAGPAEHTSDA